MQTNSKHKDRLFRFIFGNPEHKEWTLSLYNAINGSNYTNPEDIEFNTIDDIIYMGMKNDVSFLIMHVMNLWEHQSSLNPNMPIRFFLHAGQLYDKYMKDNDIYRYGTVLQRLPKPKCVCFYNGTDYQPEEKILRLSEAFGADDGDIEVRVRMMNINYGHNCTLMEACRVLNDYALLIDRIRANQKAGMNLDQAVDSAIDEMPDDSLLEKFLLSHRAEVKGMYLTEYDEEKERMRALREGRNEGRAEGRNEGRNEEKARFVSEMLRKNLPLTLIEEISQLSKDVIYSIAKNIGVPVISA
ncbi:MAG: hypothetical protein IJR27_03775 [Synergistaceae bacterium]|nr:hypothetical protein [Synergistaceae bacterium]